MKRANYQRTSARTPPLWLRVSTLVLNADWFAFPHLAEQNPKRCSGPSGNWRSNLDSRSQSECAQSVKSGQRRWSIVSFSPRKRNDRVRHRIHAEMNVEWLKGWVYGKGFFSYQLRAFYLHERRKEKQHKYRMHRICMHFWKHHYVAKRQK